MTLWRLVVLGTSAQRPTLYTELASVALLTTPRPRNAPERIDVPGGLAAEPSIWLVDAGDNTDNRLLAAPWCGPQGMQRLRGIFVTHMHGDHVYGLAQLLVTASRYGAAGPIDVVGPAGLYGYLDSALSIARGIQMPVRVTELHRGPRDRKRAPSSAPLDFMITRRVMSDDGYRWMVPPCTDHFDLRAAHLSHSVPCLGYVFSTDDKKLVVLGDTYDSRAIEECAQGCDLLVHEATFDQSTAAKARIATHSTARMAGEFARRIGAKKLMLTHFSNRFTDQRGTIYNPFLKNLDQDASKPQAIQQEELEAEARAGLVAEASWAHPDGEVFAARDRLQVAV